MYMYTYTFSPKCPFSFFLNGNFTYRFFRSTLKGRKDRLGRSSTAEFNHPHPSAVFVQPRVASSTLASWWLNQPIGKYEPKWESSPNRGEHEHFLKPPTHLKNMRTSKWVKIFPK